MRSQSSIEFLTTYGFLFLILAIVFSVLFFVAKAPATSIQTSCTAFAGPTCNFANLYSNTNSGYSVLTVVLANSQPVPINITSFSATISSNTFTGNCTPTFLYPGQWATCAAETNAAYTGTGPIDGFYTLHALFCNSGFGSANQANCAYEKVTYSGSFVARTASTDSLIFSVAALRGPSYLQLLPYNSIATDPRIPMNYTMVQNGDWVTNVTGGSATYAFATSGAQLGQNYLGHKALPFPDSVLQLFNGNVACVGSYNSTLSVASTTLYVGASSNPSVSVFAGGAMMVLYKVAQPGTVWQNVFGSGAWKEQLPTQYGPNTISLSPGLYSLEVWWSNTCGSGMQSFQMAALQGYGPSSTSVSISSSSTTTTVLVSSSTVSSTVSTTTYTTTVYYVPLTLTNSQTLATPAPFQQMIGVPSSTYSSYINSGWSNVEFTTSPNAQGTTLQAWVESSPSNTASSTTVWVDLPSGIGASSNTMIYMDFMPNNVMSAAGPTGEAPQLSSTYGQYDNGGSVFTWYNNWAGSTLSPLVSYGSNIIVAQSNGLTLNEQANWFYRIMLNVNEPSLNNIFESLWTQNCGGWQQQGLIIDSNKNTGLSSSDGAWQYPNVSYFSQLSGYPWESIYVSNALSKTDPGSSANVSVGYSGTLSLSFPYTTVDQLGQNSTSIFTSLDGYVVATDPANIVQSTNATHYTSGYLGFLTYTSGCSSDSSFIQWSRVRAYPPMKVMPSTSFGSVA